MFINSYPSGAPTSHLQQFSVSSPTSAPIFEFERLSLDGGGGCGGGGAGFWPTEYISSGFQQQQHDNNPYQAINTIPIKRSANTLIQHQVPTIVANEEIHTPHYPEMSWTPAAVAEQQHITSLQHCPTMTPVSSIQSRLIGKTTWLPLSQLIRPIAPVPLDQAKVASMVDTISRGSSNSCAMMTNGNGVPDKLPPVDVLYYKSKKTGREFHFAFGGCHRLNACEKTGQEMVECKVLKVTRGMLGGYLGGSLGAVLGEDDE